MALEGGSKTDQDGLIRKSLYRPARVARKGGSIRLAVIGLSGRWPQSAKAWSKLARMLGAESTRVPSKLKMIAFIRQASCDGIPPCAGSPQPRVHLFSNRIISAPLRKSGMYRSRRSVRHGLRRALGQTVHANCARRQTNSYLRGFSSLITGSAASTLSS